MNVLKEIVTPEDQQAICIFYDWFDTQATAEHPGNNPKGASITRKSSHCEMFCRTDLKSVSLNQHSFTLRFGNGRTVKFYIQDEQQIKPLSGMIEKTLRQGLRVKQHFASFEVYQLLKNNL